MWARMGARSTFRGPLGRLRRLAGGFWSVSGVFGVLFGSLEASRGGLEASFLPSWSLRLGALWQTFGSFEAHVGHFVEACWRLLATF